MTKKISINKKALVILHNVSGDTYSDRIISLGERTSPMTQVLSKLHTIHSDILKLNNNSNQTVPNVNNMFTKASQIGTDKVTCTHTDQECKAGVHSECSYTEACTVHIA